MKFILKILIAPVVFLLWLLCGICNISLKLSAAVLGILAIVFAGVGIITILSGAILKGCIGLVIALALSPYGIPMLAALILARLYGLRLWLTETVYG